MCLRFSSRVGFMGRKNVWWASVWQCLKIVFLFCLQVLNSLFCKLSVMLIHEKIWFICELRKWISHFIDLLITIIDKQCSCNSVYRNFFLFSKDKQREQSDEILFFLVSYVYSENKNVPLLDFPQVKNEENQKITSLQNYFWG